MSGEPMLEADVRLRHEASQSWLVTSGDEQLSRILFRDPDLFLAQNIEVGVTAGTRIDDGGKVSGKIVGVTGVHQGKSKGDLQRDLARPDGFTVSPSLTVNRHFTAGRNCIQERLAVASKSGIERYYTGEQRVTFPVEGGYHVDSTLFVHSLLLSILT